VPAPASAPGGPIIEARRWVRVADSALRSGDLEGFGRAFESLKSVLDAASDTTSP
jgi:hypothetical protein